MDAALPGPGTLRERYIAWEERNAVPRDTLVPALARLKDVLGPRAHALASMPPEESVSYELVSGEAWLAYNWYQGEYRSRIDVNADLPISIVLLADLAAHEAYPGHHTERTAKDAHLLRGLGRVETSITIISAPEALISEGIATNALEQALGTDPFAVVADVLDGLDVSFDPAEVQEINGPARRSRTSARTPPSCSTRTASRGRRSRSTCATGALASDGKAVAGDRVLHRAVVAHLRVHVQRRTAPVQGLHGARARELHTAPHRAAHRRGHPRRGLTSARERALERREEAR